MAYTSIFGITYQTLSNVTSPDAALACFDDLNTGTPLQAAVDELVQKAENEVLSWLVPEYGPAPFSTELLAQFAADPLLRYSAVDYAVAYMYERHPEYVRSGSKDRDERIKRADLRMQRLLDGRQRPPTVETPPANVGGAAVDLGPRIVTDGGDGTYNGGDYVDTAYRIGDFVFR